MSDTAPTETKFNVAEELARMIGNIDELEKLGALSMTARRKALCRVKMWADRNTRLQIGTATPYPIQGDR